MTEDDDFLARGLCVAHLSISAPHKNIHVSSSPPQPLTLTLTLTLAPTPFIPALNIRLAKPLQGEDGSLSFERRAWTRKEDEVRTLLYAKNVTKKKKCLVFPFCNSSSPFPGDRAACSKAWFASLPVPAFLAGGVGKGNDWTPMLRVLSLSLSLSPSLSPPPPWRYQALVCHKRKFE
jgi:hypothetical protein